jgi:two-component system CheB/CheR fusion protein
MAERPVRVLLVDDDEDDYVLTRDLLTEIPGAGFALTWEADVDAALAAMTRGDHDVYLLDYRLGRHTGLDLLRAAVAQGCRAPVILLTGQGEHSVDVEAMQAGAADYLLKDQLDAAGLERSIRYALQQRRHEDALRQGRDELERRVAERTAELAMVNASLQAEIAERKRVEQALQTANRRKDEFLAMLGHELRNPLAPIRNILEVVRRRGRERRGEVRKAWEIVERQVQQLTRLVEDLLDVSRIGQGKITLKRQAVDLAAVVTAAVEGCRPLLDNRKHRLEVALPGEPLRVQGDATRLTQVMQNLLNNAAKYTDPGGRIELTARREDDAAVLRVKDNGVGIAAELLPRVFDLYTQADQTLDRAHGGLGVGLTLVRKLIELHGGTVSAASAGPGQGSEFAVRLPLLEGERAAPKPAAGAAPGAKKGPQRRILVVDDNRDAAASLAMLLGLLGNETRLAHDGPGALEAAHLFKPEVVFLDIGLPGMDGYEVARRLRERPELAGTVLAALTGWGQEEDRRRAQEAGFDHHLTKPADPAALQQLLAALKPAAGA